MVVPNSILECGRKSLVPILKTVTLNIILHVTYGVRLSRISGKFCGIKV